MRKSVLLTFFLVYMLTSLGYAQKISFPLGDSYTCFKADASLNMDIRVKIDPTVPAKQFTVEIYEALFNHKQVDTVSAQTKASLEDTPKGTFLKISIDRSKLILPGSYLINLKFTAQDSTKITQDKSLTIIVKPALIKPVATVLVNITDYGFWTFDTVATRPIELQEYSMVSGLNAINIRQLSLLGQNNEGVAGKIIFGKLASIPPGGSTNIPYQLKHGFQIGKSTGDFEISSPQLLDPIPFKIEVVNRVSLIYLFLIILLGLFLGRLVRTFLTSKIDLSSAKLKATSLSRLLSSENVKYEDGPYNTEISLLIDRIKNLSGKDKSTEIVAEINAVTEAYKTLQASFFERRNKLQEEINQTTSELSSILHIPGSFRTHLTEAGITLQSVLDKNALGSVSGAASDFQSWKNSAKITLNTDIINIEAEIKKELELLSGSGSLKLPSTSVAFDLLTTKLVQPENESTVPQLFKIASDINLSAFNYINSVSSGIVNVARLFEAAFVNAGVNVPDLSAYMNFITAVSAFETKYNISPDQGIDLLTGLSDDQENIYILLLKALDSQLSMVDTAELKDGELESLESEVRTALSHGQFQLANDAVTRFLKSHPVNANPVKPSLVFANRRPAPGQSSQQEVKDGNFVRLNGLLPTLDLTTTKSEEEEIDENRGLARLTFFQNFIVLILISLIAFGLFMDTFQGTYKDFITVLFWSFGIDISLSSLLGLTGKFKVPAPT